MELMIRELDIGEVECHQQICDVCAFFEKWHQFSDSDWVYKVKSIRPKTTLRTPVMKPLL